MRQKVLLAIAVLIPVFGCENPFVHKSYWKEQLPPAQSHPDVTPSVTTVPETATYCLKSFDQLDSIPIANVRLHRGEKVGFRRESDNTLVAIAGKQTFSVPAEGTFGWVVIDRPTPGLHERNEQVTEVLDDTQKIIIVTAGIVILCGVSAFLIWYYLKHGSDSQSD
jgi:hypothetical protein